MSTTPASFIDQRRAFAIQVLTAIDPGAEPADAVVRLLTDVTHLADTRGLDLSRLAKIAQERHAIEVAEETADASDRWGRPSDGLKLRIGDGPEHITSSSRKPRRRSSLRRSSEPDDSSAG